MAAEFKEEKGRNSLPKYLLSLNPDTLHGDAEVLGSRVLAFQET